LKEVAFSPSGGGGASCPCPAHDRRQPPAGWDRTGHSPRDAIRLGNLRHGHRIAATCLKCGHRSDLPASFLARDRPPHTHLGDPQGEPRCSRRANREDNTFPEGRPAGTAAPTPQAPSAPAGRRQAPAGPADRRRPCRRGDAEAVLLRAEHMDGPPPATRIGPDHQAPDPAAIRREMPIGGAMPACRLGHRRPNSCLEHGWCSAVERHRKDAS
jgi:hypothetical protein